MAGPHHQLADLADRHLLVGLGVDQADVEPLGVEQAGCPRRPVLAVGGQDGHARLGEAEHLDEGLDAEPLLESVEDRAGGRGGEDAPEFVVGIVGTLRLLPDEVHHHADEVGDGGARPSGSDRPTS